MKKKVNLGGVESLAAETAIQFLPALGYLLWLGSQGESTFTTEGFGHSALLAATGVVTAVPLVCFGASAIRVPLSTLGLLQYLAPVFQFLLGILYFGEAMPPERWAGFALVWLALSLLTWDALRTARRTARALREQLNRAGAGVPPVKGDVAAREQGIVASGSPAPTATGGPPEQRDVGAAKP
ncbi:EamA family transporter RarD OS=Streptomyces tendae OX=1932 GN=rarD PE=3 SV=1 [Streptomyces tendae]